MVVWYVPPSSFTCKACGLSMWSVRPGLICPPMWFECKVSNWSGQQTAVQRLNNPTVQEKNGAKQRNLRKSASTANRSTVQINYTAPLRSFTYEASQWSSTVKLQCEAPMWSFTELSEENQKQGIPAALTAPLLVNLPGWRNTMWKRALTPTMRTIIELPIWLLNSHNNYWIIVVRKKQYNGCGRMRKQISTIFTILAQ